MLWKHVELGVEHGSLGEIELREHWENDHDTVSPETDDVTVTAPSLTAGLKFVLSIFQRRYPRVKLKMGTAWWLTALEENREDSPSETERDERVLTVEGIWLTCQIVSFLSVTLESVNRKKVRGWGVMKETFKLD